LGRRVAPAPVRSPSEKGSVHALNDELEPVCGTTGRLYSLPGEWPPGNPDIRCPACLAATGKG
jgi:hypothetical protein